MVFDRRGGDKDSGNKSAQMRLASFFSLPHCFSLFHMYIHTIYTHTHIYSMSALVGISGVGTGMSLDLPSMGRV